MTRELLVEMTCIPWRKNACNCQNRQRVDTILQPSTWWMHWGKYFHQLTSNPTLHPHLNHFLYFFSPQIYIPLALNEWGIQGVSTAVREREREKERDRGHQYQSLRVFASEGNMVLVRHLGAVVDGASWNIALKMLVHEKGDRR